MNRLSGGLPLPHSGHFVPFRTLPGTGPSAAVLAPRGSLTCMCHCRVVHVAKSWTGRYDEMLGASGLCTRSSGGPVRGRDSRVLCDVSCTRQSGFCLMCSPSLRVFMVRHQRQHFRRPSRTCWEKPGAGREGRLSLAASGSSGAVEMAARHSRPRDGD